MHIYSFLKKEEIVRNYCISEKGVIKLHSSDTRELKEARHFYCPLSSNPAIVTNASYQPPGKISYDAMT